MGPAVKCLSLEIFLPKSVFQHYPAACLVQRSQRVRFTAAFPFAQPGRAASLLSLCCAYTAGCSGNWSVSPGGSKDNPRRIRTRRIRTRRTVHGALCGRSPDTGAAAPAAAHKVFPWESLSLLSLLAPHHTSHFRALQAEASPHYMNINYSITWKIIAVAVILPHFPSFALKLRNPHLSVCSVSFWPRVKLVSHNECIQAQPWSC